MPWIIDYDIVLEQTREQNLRCNYYNSGAFAFPDATAVHTVAWIGPEDDSIRPAARPFVRQISAPYEPTLAALATRVWQHHLPGRVWAMPMSHWAYELHYGSREWMPALLENIELDPGLLDGRNNAAAIEFAPHETRHFSYFTQRLLEMLLGSDFMLAFPRRNVLCMLHHHKQLWWQSSDQNLLTAIDNTRSQPG